MRTNGKLTILASVLIALCFGLSVVMTQHLERNRPPLPAGYEDDGSGLEARRLKGFVFGAEGLIADWYWINSLQYIGKKITNSELEYIDLNDMRNLNPRLLYPYLKNAVEMDPHFIPAYSYGAIMLPAIDPEKAIELAKDGIRNNPDEWRLYHYLGYIYWKQQKFREAEEVYTQGSKVAGAPSFLAMMAASMRSSGGDRETARLMYQGMYDQADSDSTREPIRLRLLEIDWLDERDAISAALIEIKDATGRCPKRLSEVIPRLRTVKLPRGRSFTLNERNELVDPTAVPYELDAGECVVRLSPDSKIPKF
jgi:tetratricopeptide (TPR) repeat protein